MGRGKRERLEFRYYEIPQQESVLALLGDSWRGAYGRDDKYLHFHNLLEIGVCHQGRGILTLDSRECPYADGMISVIPANCPHTTLSEKEDFWEFLFLDPAQLLREMYPNNARLRDKQLAVINRRALLLEPAEGAALSALANGIISEMQRKEPYYREAVRHLVEVLLYCLLRLNEELGVASAQEPVSRPQIQPALAYIEAHFQGDIRAEDLARECGLSEPHFRRVFREYVGASPIDYLNTVRVREACRVMDQRDCPMDLVAAECGFASVSAFTRNFKKLLGTTPYQWKLRQEKDGGKLRDYNITVLKGWESL